MIFRSTFILGFTFLILSGSGYSQTYSPFNQGVLYIQEENYESAIPQFKKSIEDNYQVLQSYKLLTRAYALNKNPELALETVDKALVEFPNDAILQFIRGEVYISLDKLKAVQIFEELTKRHANIEAIEETGVTLNQINLQISNIYSEIGTTQFEEGRREDAVNSFRKSLKYNEGSAQIYNNLIYLLIITNRSEEALEVATNAVIKFPELENLKLLKYQAMSMSGNNEESLKGFESIYRSTPSNAQAAIFYGRSLIQNNKLLQASEHFNTHLENYPNQAEVYDALIQMNKQRFDFAAVAEVYERQANVFTEELDIKIELAKYYALSSQYEKSVELYLELYNSGNCESCLIRAAEVLLIDEQTTSASVLLEDNRQKFSNKYEINSILIAIQNHLTEFESAGETAQILSGLDYRSYFAEMEILKALLRTSKTAAIARAEMLTEVASNSGGFPLLVLAKESSNNDRYELALRGVHLQSVIVENLSKQIEESAQKALSGDPDLQVPVIGLTDRLKRSEKILIDLLDLLFEQDDTQKVEDVFVNLAYQYPQNGIIMSYYANALANNGNQSEAISTLNQALEKLPEEIDLHIQAADIYYRTGDLNNAILSWERILSIDNKNETAYRKLIQFHRENNSLDRLISRWQVRYRTDKKNDLLKQFLIEALHKSDRFEEAAKLISSD